MINVGMTAEGHVNACREDATELCVPVQINIIDHELLFLSDVPYFEFFFLHMLISVRAAFWRA